MQQRLRHQLDERERLFSAVSHDLKTPITRLRLRAEMLDDPRQRERFCASLDELDTLVRGALASVKGLDLHEQARPLCLRSLLLELSAELDLLGGRVAVEGQASPLVVKPLAIKRALANLLENAVFYGDRARVVLDESATTLTLSISDEGPGIDESQLARVWEPFVRLEPSRSRHTGGSGLGLGIARHIIEAHGGDIRLANRAEGGLQVSVALPRHGPYAC